MGKGAGDLYIKAECMLLTKTFVEDCLWHPKLDGTDSKTQLSGTTTFSNGVMRGGSAYVKEFSNANDWILTFESMKESNNSGYALVKSTDTSRDKNCIKFTADGYIFSYNNGSETNHGKKFTPNADTWYNWEIKKQNGVLTVSFDNSSPVTVNWSLISSITSLGFGVDSWGGVTNIRNIKVKPL